MKRIDFRSDTCTLPSNEMRKVIFEAEVGDQGYWEDLTTLRLEEYCANLFGKESALFMPSGTMSDQVALRSWTKSGDEVILDESYHISYFQTGPSTDLGKIFLSTTRTSDGILTPDHVKNQMEVRKRGDRFPDIGLVSIENTISGQAGRIFPLEAQKELYQWCNKNHIPVHMDGERVLNACVKKNIEPHVYAMYTDSITCSFSKGLAAPFGSILMGKKSFINKARKFRKWYGGSLHQSGFMAAAALYAIKNNISRLSEDHENAFLLYENIKKDFPDLEIVVPETNIVMINIQSSNVSAKQFTNNCAENGILCHPWKSQIVRFVTHYGITKADICYASDIIKRTISDLKI